jgi:hypothetical protein
MCQVNIFKAKTELSRLIALLESEAEDEIVIARNGKPVARILPWVGKMLTNVLVWQKDCLCYLKIPMSWMKQSLHCFQGPWNDYTPRYPYCPLVAYR